MNRSTLVRLLLLALIWGCSFLFIKVADEGLAPFQVVLGRISSGMLVLVAIVVAQRRRLPTRPVVWGHLVVVGVLANLIPFFLFAWGEQRVPSSLAGIYNATTPLFTLLVATAALPEERRPSAGRLVGLVLGFVGVGVVLSPWHGGHGASLAGQLACLGAGACYAFAIVYTRRFLSSSGHSPVVLAAGQLICATATLLVAVPLWTSRTPAISLRVAASVLALGMLGTGIAYVIFYSLIADVGATTASTVTYVVPLFAVALGVAALGEHVGWNDLLGALVVVAGIAAAEGRLKPSLFATGWRRGAGTGEVTEAE
jgi:drug/metabolite transporter (DMT)-like permease